jgi:hypothetical protein
MQCKYIPISLEVRSIILPGASCFLSFVAEWNAGDRGQPFQWRATSNSDVIYHSARLQTQAVFNEVNSQAEWGTLYYATKAVSDNCLPTFRSLSL